MTLQVGLIGCGHISAAHLRSWRRAAGCRVIGLFDLDRQLAQRRARQFAIARVYGDVEEALAECDVIDVCTPPQTHAEIAARVLAAGRHLLIEKPVVTRLEEWERLRDLLARGGGLTVVHNLKYAHSTLRARSWLEGGAIGGLVRFERLFLTAPSRDRMLTGGDHWSHHLPGGRWFETLPHELYLLHCLAGALELSEVIALPDGSLRAAVPAAEVLVVLRDDRRIASLHYSANCELNRRSMTLYGERGSIHVDSPSDTAMLSTTRDARWLRPVGVPVIGAGGTFARMLPDRLGYLVRRLRGDSAHGRLIAALADHLLRGGPPPTPLEEIDYVVRNADRIGREIDRQSR